MRALPNSYETLKKIFPMSDTSSSARQVLPRWRGFGIGAALAQEVMDQAAREGAPELICLGFQDNSAALNLYGDLGFAPAIIPALEEQLEEEERTEGWRRVLLRKALS